MSDFQSAISGTQTFNLFLGIVIAVVVGGIISVTNFIYSRKKDKFNSLFGVFNYLNGDKHREARRVLYYGPNADASRMILGFDAPPTVIVRVSMDVVRDDMDQMGLMVKTGLIPEVEFLERYWKAVVDCRWHLESNISERRLMRGYEDYVKNFDYLRDRACKYAQENNLLKDQWVERCNYNTEVQVNAIEKAKGSPF